MGDKGQEMSLVQIQTQVLQVYGMDISDDCAAVPPSGSKNLNSDERTITCIRTINNEI